MNESISEVGCLDNKIKGEGDILESNKNTKNIHYSNNIYLQDSSFNTDIQIHQLVLWRHPITTLKFFLLEINLGLKKLIKKIKRNRIKVSLFILLITLMLLSCYMPGPHQKHLQNSKQKIFWCVYWIGLGVLSSIGLGTGLHTFVLYLGPHIASVTIAAYECNSLKFPEPPYPDEIICPSKLALTGPNGMVSLWAIMRKVYLEAMMWGAGTALGELPPYFMAKAARTSGSQPFDENYEVFEELLEQRSQLQMNQLSYLDRAKLFMQNLVQNVGFSGILLCASIPNPLFDFAGITCGHFNVPFWTFFGATLIGKAVVKVHVQELFVIVAFSEHHVDRLVAILKYVPFIGVYLQSPFKEYLVTQQAKLHRSKKHSLHRSTWLAWCFEKILLITVIYFVISIVNSMAQKYKFRLDKHRHKNPKIKSSHIAESKSN
ncbi:unnamed protein product [Gordionus sp. m RMFG-2023]